MNCTKCGTEFEPKAYQLRKRYHQCPMCRNASMSAYRRRRTLEGNSVHKKTLEQFRLQARRRWRDPECRMKKIARDKARRAVKAGKLIPQPCRDCGSVEVEAHHPDYAQPLSVIWLCSKCHRLEHDRLRDDSSSSL